MQIVVHVRIRMAIPGAPSLPDFFNFGNTSNNSYTQLICHPLFQPAPSPHAEIIQRSIDRVARCDAPTLLHISATPTSWCSTGTCSVETSSLERVSFLIKRGYVTDKATKIQNMYDCWPQP